MSFINWNNSKPDKNHFLKDISDSPDLMLKLSDTIIKVHTSKGASSPLSGSLAAELAFKANAAREKHETAQRFSKLANEALAERDELLGIRPAEKQQSTAPTLKFYLSCVFEILGPQLEKDKKAFVEWGFEKM